MKSVLPNVQLQGLARAPSLRLLLMEPLLLLPVQGQTLLGLWASPATYCRVHLVFMYFLLLFPAALYCVCFSAHSACLNQTSCSLHVFLEILLRNEPAEGVGCGFWCLVGFFFVRKL